MARSSQAAGLLTSRLCRGMPTSGAGFRDSEAAFVVVFEQLTIASHADGDIGLVASLSAENPRRGRYRKNPVQ